MLIDPQNNLELKKAKMYFNKLISSGSKFELKKIIPKRSISLNSYLHVCISIYAIEYGYTVKEAKTYLKRVCPFMVYEKNGNKFLKETSKMDNQECSDFVEWIRNYSAQNGLYIPDAEEYKLSKYEIDKQIDQHKQYIPGYPFC